MKILIKPSDIIERTLWDTYEKYCLLTKTNISKDDITKIIDENIEFEIQEEDAFVIGLLKCLETPDLSHRLNQHINELISTRSVEIEKKKTKNTIDETVDVEISNDLDDSEESDEYTTVKKKYFYMIKKKILVEYIKKFKNKFPSAWKPSILYEKSLYDVLEYITYLSEQIEKLEVYTHTDNNGTHEMLYCNHIKKMLKFYN